jgi:aspartyl-tRNA(Asn)/glutamyl-tRNA(Gln) amidotransferase subunit C
MKIEDLQETARLAHLNMDEKELAGAFPAFEQMLGFFAVMQAADKDTEAFSAGSTDLSGPSRSVSSAHFRSDASRNNPNSSHNTASAGLNDPAPDPRRTLCQNLLDNAGDRDGRFIVVPNVL